MPAEAKPGLYRGEVTVRAEKGGEEIARRLVEALDLVDIRVLDHLVIGDQVLGVMDVQSDQLGAFHPNDLLILDVPDYRHLGYQFGTNLVEAVIKNGRIFYVKEAK